MDLLLNTPLQGYTIRTLLAPDDHPCKPILISLMRENLPKLHGVSLRRIAEQLSDLILLNETLEDRSTTTDPFTEAPTIAQADKKTEAATHKA